MRRPGRGAPVCRLAQRDAVLPFDAYDFEARSDGGLVCRTAFTVREDVEDPTRIDVPRVDR